MTTGTPDGEVSLTIEAGIATVLFDRPRAHNAMTWHMYQRLGAHCTRLMQERGVRVVVFRGAGGRAFVAGTDIEQFKAFRGGDDGVAYEREIDAGIARIGALPQPTVAVLEGWTVGGGLAIATACDFRIATPDTRLGVPIARTLGNCLSIANVARLCSAFGVQRTRRMLMLAESIDADEGLSCGYLHRVASADALDAELAELLTQLTALAPLTQRAAKQALGRLLEHDLPNDEDILRVVYGSHDFSEGVRAFVEKRRPVWRGD